MLTEEVDVVEGERSGSLEKKTKGTSRGLISSLTVYLPHLRVARGKGYSAGENLWRADYHYPGLITFNP